ncbi:MAG: pantetheine-phosphate adenylyltransferase [Clostridia bacterium]|nr:pantetheine-phosphate adenylyltransferase [Clostridia bacterium]
MKYAIIPGSFDPVTLGHVDIIRRAAHLFDKVFPVVLVNTEKRYMFTEDERLRILKCACRSIENAECHVFEGLTSDFAESVGAGFIAKGVRNTTDFDYEAGLSQIMKKFDSRLETVLIPSAPELSYMSSTYARERIKYGCDLSDFADGETARLICEIVGSKNK